MLFCLKYFHLYLVAQKIIWYQSFNILNQSFITYFQKKINMKFAVSVILTLSGIVLTQSEVTLPCQDKLAEIDVLLDEKQNLLYDRQGDFNDVFGKLQSITLQLESYFETKQAAINAYTVYYNQKKKCEGLKQKMVSLDNISSFSGNQCLETPISSIAENLFNSKMFQDGHQENVEYQQRLVNNFFDFKIDFSNQAQLLSTIKQIYSQKIAVLQQNLNNCLGEEQCNEISTQLNKAKSIQNLYSNKAWSKQNQAYIAQQSYILELNELTNDKSARDTAENAYNTHKIYIDQQKQTCENQLSDEINQLNGLLKSMKSMKETIDQSIIDFKAGTEALKAKTQIIKDKGDVIDGKIEQLSVCWQAANQ